MMDDNALLRVQTITPKKLYQAQREDRAIGEVIEYTKKETNHQYYKTGRGHRPTFNPSCVYTRNYTLEKMESSVAPIEHIS